MQLGTSRVESSPGKRTEAADSHSVASVYVILCEPTKAKQDSLQLMKIFRTETCSAPLFSELQLEMAKPPVSVTIDSWWRNETTP